MLFETILSREVEKIKARKLGQFSDSVPELILGKNASINNWAADKMIVNIGVRRMLESSTEIVV
jgi:hypothetical protein